MNHFFNETPRKQSLNFHLQLINFGSQHNSRWQPQPTCLKKHDVYKIEETQIEMLTLLFLIHFLIVFTVYCFYDRSWRLQFWFF